MARDAGGPVGRCDRDARRPGRRRSARWLSDDLPYLLADLLASGRLGDATREIKAHRRVQGGSGRSIAQAVITPFLPRDVRWRLRGRRGDAHALVGPSLQDIDPTRERADITNLPDRLRRQYGLILLERGLPELLRTGPKLDGALDRGARSVP